jgi:endonuclease YncB( thermonuclease family)
MNTCAALALCSVLHGQPTVIDGDTLRFGRETVRIFGIDAEELNETNGPRAREALQSLVIESGTLRCQKTGEATHGRSVARCYVSIGHDVAAILVSWGVVLDCARYSGGVYRRFEPVGVRSRLTQKPYCNQRKG